MSNKLSTEELARIVTPLDQLDQDRPYVMASDGTALQLHPTEEKALLDENIDDAKFAVFEELHRAQDELEARIARSQVDATVPDQVRRAVPASGSNVATIEIHMRQVFAHLIGRRNVEDKPNIMGLFGFGSNVNRLVQGYEKGCPYAAWMLIQVEQEILSLRQKLQKMGDEANTMIAGLNVGIEYTAFTSSRPTTETLQFHAVHAHQISSVLKLYDDLLRRLFPYLRNHFITDAEFKRMTLAIGKDLRRLFVLPTSWFYVGREACEAKDVAYLAASNKLGGLPDTILSGDEKPEWV